MGMFIEIAAVQPYAFDRYALRGQTGRQVHHFCSSGLGIVSIDQQHDVIRIGLGEMFEGLAFFNMGLNKGVGHGAIYRDAEKLSGGNGRGTAEARQITGARREQSGLRSMRPAHAEIHQ